jgi:TetR/AcrR family transcriptional regulator, mexJK operon transcriptional repressor
MPRTSHRNEAADETRAARKQRAILDAAGQVFLENGYVGTSMDQIAAVAAVSKQTVYKHFADKETLFRALITETVARNGEATAGEVVLRGELPFEEELRAFARRLLHGVMQRRVLQLRRVVIGEATRFPALGRSFYDLGVGRTTDKISAALTRLADEGHLEIDDPRVAAEHLIWLVLSIPLNRAMLLGDDHGIRAADLDGCADAGIDAFLAAYRLRRR